MNYIKLTEYERIKNGVMGLIKSWVDNGLITTERALAMVDLVYSVELTGDYEIFAEVRDQLDEGRYI